MRIRARLLAGFGFYILFALVLGVFVYGELRAITAGLGVVEAADDLATSMLEVRRYEKNYLLFRDAENSRSLKRYLADMRAGVELLESATAGEAAPGSFAAMREAAARYEAIFDELSRPRGRQDQAESEAALERLRATDIARDHAQARGGPVRRERRGGRHDLHSRGAAPAPARRGGAGLSPPAEHPAHGPSAG